MPDLETILTNARQHHEFYTQSPVRTRLWDLKRDMELKYEIKISSGPNMVRYYQWLPWERSPWMPRTPMCNYTAFANCPLPTPKPLFQQSMSLSPSLPFLAEYVHTLATCLWSFTHIKTEYLMRMWNSVHLADLWAQSSAPMPKHTLHPWELWLAGSSASCGIGEVRSIIWAAERPSAFAQLKKVSKLPALHSVQLFTGSYFS